MRPISVLSLAVAGFGALGFAPALAAPRHHAPAPGVSSAQSSVEQLNKRSWLNPGNATERHDGANYMTAVTHFNETPDEAYFPSRFHEDSLPSPLYPTGEPHPILRFWTPAPND